MTEYEEIDYGPLSVSYTPELDGGGSTFGRAYPAFVRDRIGKVGRAFEWCAGPGFIGFSLLAEGLCDELDLGDLNVAAQRAVARTVRRNSLGDRVAFHLSDCFAQVPAELRWDLVVGNPPHVNQTAPVSEYQHSRSPLIWQDADWAVHRRFYAEAAHRLSPNGSIVVQENHRFSEPEDFRRMIEDSGLKVVDAIPCGTEFPHYYFLWSRSPR